MEAWGWDVPLEELQEKFRNYTVVDRINFSGMSPKYILETARECREKAAKRKDDVLPHMTDRDVANYWFGNELRTSFKSRIKASPSDKRGCTQKVLERDAQRDMLATYQNGCMCPEIVIEKLEEWAKKELAETAQKQGRVVGRDT